jgi:hypothetical protein
MTDTNTQLTQQQEDEQVEYRRQQTESAIFIRRHAEFKTNSTNAKKLSDWMTANQKFWSAQNLEEAYAALRSELELVEEPPVVAPSEETPKEEWGDLTKASIAAMPSELYAKFHRNPRFTRQVNNVLAGRNQNE